MRHRDREEARKRGGEAEDTGGDSWAVTEAEGGTHSNGSKPGHGNLGSSDASSIVDMRVICACEYVTYRCVCICTDALFMREI